MCTASPESPASITATLTFASSDKRLAMTRPAVPPPTITCNAPQFRSDAAGGSAYVVEGLLCESRGVDDGVGAFEDATALPILPEMGAPHGQVSEESDGESRLSDACLASCHSVELKVENL